MYEDRQPLESRVRREGLKSSHVPDKVQHNVIAHVTAKTMTRESVSTGIFLKDSAKSSEKSKLGKSGRADKNQNGFLDVFFKDHSVAMDAKKTHAIKSVRAKHASILSKAASTAYSGYSENSKKQAGSHITASAFLSAAVKSAPSSVQSKTKVVRKPIDYGGIFGDPFADDSVTAANAHQAAPSWL